MSTKRALATLGWLLVLGSSLVMAQENSEQGAANMVRNKVRVQTKAQPMVQTRARFMDQNGDGINDFQRDHDNDGIPNCQDPDWTRPGDGTGSKNRFAKNVSQNQGAGRKGIQGAQGWSNSSFRNGFNGLGGGICDGTGPRGGGQRRGRG